MALTSVLKKWDAGYNQLLDLFSLPTLKSRRLYLRFACYFKLYAFFFLLMLLYLILVLLIILDLFLYL